MSVGEYVRSTWHTLNGLDLDDRDPRCKDLLDVHLPAHPVSHQHRDQLIEELTGILHAHGCTIHHDIDVSFHANNGEKSVSTPFSYKLCLPSW
jgi:hypothetical protein